MEGSLKLEEDTLLRRQTIRLFSSYLVELLGGSDSARLCTGTVYIPYLVFRKGTTYTNQNPSDTSIITSSLSSFIMNMTEFDSVVAKTGRTSEVTKVFAEFRNQTIDFLGLTLEECKKRFFVMSAILIPLGSLEGHQTIMLFDKEKGECLLVDPQTEPGQVNNSLLKLYKSLLERLGASHYKIVQQQEQCVQAVAKDNNCMFWSLLLIAKYMQGGFASIDSVSTFILKQNPTPEALKVYIEGFKSRLFKQASVIPELLPPVAPPSRGEGVQPGGMKTNSRRRKANGWKWAASMGNRSLRRVRRLRKNNSKSWKSARRTRRRV